MPISHKLVPFTAVAVLFGPSSLLPEGAGDSLPFHIPVAAACELVNPCGDVNDSGDVTSSDALTVLRLAVGQPVTAQCDVSGSSGSASLLKTGQTECHDHTGSEIDCAGTGQDAETKAGVALGYTDNGNGTITDEKTGLIWEKQDDNNLEGIAGIHDMNGQYSFTTFVEKLETFNTFSFGGRNDWRAPNLREIQSLLNYGRNDPAISVAFDTSCTPGCTTSTCSCTGANTSYWSSTEYDEVRSYAWAVYFKDGQVTPNGKNTQFYFRAVAGGL